MLTVALLALPVGVQQPVPAVPQLGWPLGFEVIDSDAVPSGSWMEWVPSACDLSISEIGDGLEVRVDGSDGYTYASVHLWLEPTGARALVSYGSCTGYWVPHIVAGTTCLVTDGTRATLQFEIYEGGFDWLGQHVRGQVELGGNGVELARRWTRPTGEGHRRERVEFSCQGGALHDRHARMMFEALGTVDALGRRQGLWIVRELGAEQPILEVMWRDGLPHGVFRKYENGTVLLKVGQFENGFQQGQQMIWYPDGKRHVAEYRHGTLERVANYGPDGSLLRNSDGFGDLSPSADAHWKRISEFYTRR